MNQEEIKETKVWVLYERCQMYARKTDIYESTDLNYRMYNDDQWAGVKLEGIEPVQLNFIKPIVNYKVGAISQNLWAINYSPDNLDNIDFIPEARKACELLNKKTAKIWENTYMDFKVRQICKDAAINGECPIYINYNEDIKTPEIELLNKPDIYYGNENSTDIQKQPFILIKKRMPVSTARQFAIDNGVSEKDSELIIGDIETFEEAGASAKEELDYMATIVYKFYKENKRVKLSISSKYIDIIKDNDTQLSLYPIAHMIWEDKKGSARGSGEITVGLIANQREVNKTLMRRALVTKNTAFPQKVINVDMIENPSAVNKVGGIIKVKGINVQSVQSAFANIPPAQMSTDVEKLQEDLIQTSRELAAASQAATGDVKPDEASGRAILAVQQASQQPLVEQLNNIKRTIEDIARINLDMIKTYNEDGLIIEIETINPETGENETQLQKLDSIVLDELQATVKVDITPKSAFDKFAQEKSIENLFINGMFNPQMLKQLKFYLECLDDDSVMPKQKLLEKVNQELEKQTRIAQIQAQAQQEIQAQQQFYNQEPDAQATLMMKEKLKNKIKQAYLANKQSNNVQQVEQAIDEENTEKAEKNNARE